VTESKTKLRFSLLLASVLILVIFGCLVYAQQEEEAEVEDEAESGAEAAPDSTIRRLQPFEIVSHQIQLPDNVAPVLKELGFDQLVNLMNDGRNVQALNDALYLKLRQPALWQVPEFRLLLAEIYFRLGIDHPEIQFDVAKPLYEELMIACPHETPNWYNQPLVAFRLAVINDRQENTPEAVALYGLLIDWYPQSSLADKARLGLVMASLSEGQLRDSEEQAEAILASTQDAFVRYHAALGLATTRFQLGRYKEAAADFDSVITWPDDLKYLEGYELYAFAGTMAQIGRTRPAVAAFLDYLDRYPRASEAPLAVLQVSELARRENPDFAVTGYKYLIINHGESWAGMKARLELAGIRMENYTGREELTEKLLLEVYNQLNYHDLQQTASLDLAQYYYTIDRPALTAMLGAEVFDNPLNLSLAQRSLDLINRAFSRLLILHADNPMIMANLYRMYADYMPEQAFPKETYLRLAEAFYEGLQADSLAKLAGNAGLNRRFPMRSALLAAQAEWLRGDAEAAIKHLMRLMDLTSETEEADSLRLAGRLLWAEIARETGKPREALQQLALARTDAGTAVDHGRLEMLAGEILLDDDAPRAALERLANAVRLLGETSGEQPLRTWQERARTDLGEALYRAGRSDEAEKVFTELRGIKPERLHDSLAAIRLAQIAARRDKPVPAPEEGATGHFWPDSAARLIRFLAWQRDNRSRFSAEPDWQRLP